MKHKKLFVSLTAVFAVIIFLAIFLTVWFFGDSYEDFEDNFVKEFGIAGLEDGAVPQGLGTCSSSYVSESTDGETTSKTDQFFFVTAYMVDGSPSRIYVTGNDFGYIGYVTMKNTDGTDYTGHCGGIATNGTYLWVTGEDTVFVAKASEGYDNIAKEIVAKAMSDQAEKSIAFTASFNANCNASFCFYYDDPNYVSTSYDRLYVGEFYRKGNYETEMTHRLTTPNGYANTAFAYEFNVSNTGDYGLTTLNSTYPNALSDENNVPEIKKILSLPEKIQGFARAGNTLVLSQSYGLANSHILCYDWTQITSNTANRAKYTDITGLNFNYAGIKRPTGVDFTVSSLYVYYVDNYNEDVFLNDYSIPSMSEGLCAIDKKVYVLFESAGKKYRRFVRQQLKNVYSITF